MTIPGTASILFSFIILVCLCFRSAFEYHKSVFGANSHIISTFPSLKSEWAMNLNSVFHTVCQPSDDVCVVCWHLSYISFLSVNRTKRRGSYFLPSFTIDEIAEITTVMLLCTKRRLFLATSLSNLETKKNKKMYTTF